MFFNASETKQGLRLAHAASLQHHRASAIRRAMDAADLTVESLASAIGMNRGHLSAVLHGARPMSFEHEAALLTTIEVEAVLQVEELVPNYFHATKRVRDVPKERMLEMAVIACKRPKLVFERSGLATKLLAQVLDSVAAFGGQVDQVEHHAIEVPGSKDLEIDGHLYEGELSVTWRVGGEWFQDLDGLPTPYTDDLDGLIIVDSR